MRARRSMNCCIIAATLGTSPAFPSVRAANSITPHPDGIKLVTQLRIRVTKKKKNSDIQTTPNYA